MLSTGDVHEGRLRVMTLSSFCYFRRYEIRIRTFNW